MKSYLLLLILFLSSISLRAQMERTVYQSFEIDTAKTIALKVVGEYELQAWAGNSVLTETNIQIWKASPRILDYFIEKGRYEFLQESSPDATYLSSRFMERQPIKTKDGECVEIIKVKIFVPDTFEWLPDGKNFLTKKPVPVEKPD